MGDPQITAPGQALVRPVLVACATSTSRGMVDCRCRPDMRSVMRGLAEVIAVGDEVRSVRWATSGRAVSISCGNCRECRRGVTGSCASLPLMAMWDGPLAAWMAADSCPIWY
jgi:threonine dehydrogenase-like Zn-dependent dehydrogenase